MIQSDTHLVVLWYSITIFPHSFSCKFPVFTLLSEYMYSRFLGLALLSGNILVTFEFRLAYIQVHIVLTRRFTYNLLQLFQQSLPAK
jgi:hypothetical protein